MYLGIDPGRQKFGWALTEENGIFCASGIVPFDQLELFAQKADQSPSDLNLWLIEGNVPLGIRIRRVYCGDGTGHREFLMALTLKNFDVQLVKETNTTLEARKLYWKLHRPRGWRRLIPLSLQVPPRSIDDLAACCILRRALLTDQL
ncbi:MAG: endonuclease [Pyramidobacter sp.]|jgi:RNase H-fold protein (predicted Holliday junction resolvase)